MKKIFTIRDVEAQREHMWSARRIEEEVAACSRRNIARHFLAWLPRDARVVEAGCGLGAWVVFLSEQGYDIAGIDNDAGVIERLKAWRPSLDVSFGDIRKLPYADDEVGAVISLGVVEHFEEGCAEAMREAHRVLRPGGLLFLTVPMENLFRKIFAHPLRSIYLRYRQFAGDPVHFAEYRYTRGEVLSMVRDSGFEPVLTDRDDFDPPWMSLGIWSDFPPLQGKSLYEMNALGRMAARGLNFISPRIAAGGVLCIGRKAGR